jgi:hypothetical protein
MGDLFEIAVFVYASEFAGSYFWFLKKILVSFGSFWDLKSENKKGKVGFVLW